MRDAEVQELERRSWTITVCTGCWERILVIGHADKCPGAAELAVKVDPSFVAERYRDALGLLRGYVTDDEGWKLINDALWLGPRDENDDPIYTEKPT